MFGRHIAPIRAFIVLGLSLVLLSGCTKLMETGLDRNKGALLSQSSYAAADMMIQQSRSFITQETPLEIGVLTDLDSPNERTNFGSMVAEQIASRFVQLGYNVTVGDMGLGSGMGQGAPNTGHSVITGRYAVARDEVLVNLRLVEAGAGKVLAAYDYSVRKTPDIRELTKTQADKDSFFNF